MTSKIGVNVAIISEKKVCILIYTCTTIAKVTKEKERNGNKFLVTTEGYCGEDKNCNSI